MVIAIIGAMAIEIEYFLREIGYKEKIVKNGYSFWLSEYANKQIIIASSGVGKVATAILSTTLVNLFPKLDLIINIGVAGGVKGKTKIGDVVTFAKYAYYDADATHFPQYVHGQIPGYPAYFEGNSEFLNICKEFTGQIQIGMVLTGDLFFTDQEVIEAAIAKHFPLDNVISLDMESTAFAQSFYHLGFPFASLRVISDIIGGIEDEYEKNLTICSEKACQYLLAILKKM